MKRRWLDIATNGGLMMYGAIFALFIILPIASSFIFSFNSDRFPSLPLGDFDFRWYVEAWSDTKDLVGLRRTLTIGVMAAATATFLGLGAAYVDWRTRHFVGKTVFLILILLPPTVPLAILGLAYLAYFSQLGIVGGMVAVYLAHSVICLPFAMAIIRLRLSQMDGNLEAVAWNLGASEWMAMRHVIIPFIKPAVIASFLVTLALSFDEFAIAWFVSGVEETLPVRVLNLLAGPVSPRINVIGTVTFAVTITLIIAAQILMGQYDEHSG